MIVVVDTNVAVVANGRGTHADKSCQLACVERLECIKERGIIAIDDTGNILDEYARQLRYSGYPGVGDKFFKYLVDHQYHSRRVQRVSVTPSNNDQRGFEELPANDLDRSDRKFLAVALVANAIVLNATDSDWEQEAMLLDTLGVKIDQICPQYASGRAGRSQ
ncbi:MAG: hypothetical protein OYK82_01415 [Gammaproteobacteria bacterium]|nr:hypothetical protein [Gammaproteobacteria bacterium]